MPSLSDFRKRPSTSFISIAAVPVSEVVKRYNEDEGYYLSLSKDNKTTVMAEAIAVDFYFQNALMAELGKHYHPDQPLLDLSRVPVEYYSSLNTHAIRMFFYLLLICTRESRHASLGADAKKVLGEFGSLAFLGTITGSSSSGAVATFLGAPPATSLGAYTDHLVKIFELGSFSSGFGGGPWANVAKCLREFVHGRTTAEMMLDTSFTLAHNNGPIFNKGMLFLQYIKEELIRILDVQRAGFMPSYIEEKKPYTTYAHRDLLEFFKSKFPTVGGPIDWHQVVKLGAVGSYSKELAKAKVKKANPIVPLGPTLEILPGMVVPLLKPVRKTKKKLAA